MNIIPLCSNCHEDFDDYKIGISPDKRSFVVLTDGRELVETASKVSIVDLKDEYVLARNEKARLPIRLHLGLVPGYEHYRTKARKHT